MRKAPLLSCLIWSSLAACGDDSPTFVDAGRPIDAAAPAPRAIVPASATAPATCGEAAATVDLTLGNQGQATLELTEAQITGGFALVTSLPITVAPGATTTVTVRAPMAVIGTDRAGVTRTGTLTFTSNQPGGLTPIALESPVAGANLALVDTEGTELTTLAFSATSGCPAPQAVRIRNNGTQPATVTSPSGSSFSFGTLTPGATIAPGQTIEQTVSLFTLGPCAGTEMVSYDATGVVCTGPTVPLTLTFTVSSGSSCYCS